LMQSRIRPINFIRIRILLIIKVMQVCDHYRPTIVYIEPPCLLSLTLIGIYCRSGFWVWLFVKLILTVFYIAMIATRKKSQFTIPVPDPHGSTLVWLSWMVGTYLDTTKWCRWMQCCDIRDILGWIRFCGSVPLTYGSGSRSCSFCQWHRRG
jgi:hypothetical protein